MTIGDPRRLMQGQCRDHHSGDAFFAGFLDGLRRFD